MPLDTGLDCGENQLFRLHSVHLLEFPLRSVVLCQWCRLSFEYMETFANGLVVVIRSAIDLSPFEQPLYELLLHYLQLQCHVELDALVNKVIV